MAVAAEPPALASAPFNTVQAGEHQTAWAAHLNTPVEVDNSIGMALRLIPPGDFLMGSDDAAVEQAITLAEQAGAQQRTIDRFRQAERPQRRVTVPRPYWIGRTEVTVGQFRCFVEAIGYRTEAEQYGFGNGTGRQPRERMPAENRTLHWRNPGYVATDNHPVTQITWNDAVAFCNWLSEHEQRAVCYRRDDQGGWQIDLAANGYRLPTEVEWENACRAGTTTHFFCGDDPAELLEYGWYVDNSDGGAQPVATRRPNPFGLYDMHGNAREWCHDWFDEQWYQRGPAKNNVGPPRGGQRIARGSNWSTAAINCRSAFRNSYVPTLRFFSSGFRCARNQ